MFLGWLVERRCLVMDRMQAMAAGAKVGIMSEAESIINSIRQQSTALSGQRLGGGVQ